MTELLFISIEKTPLSDVKIISSDLLQIELIAPGLDITIQSFSS